MKGLSVQVYLLYHLQFKASLYHFFPGIKGSSGNCNSPSVMKMWHQALECLSSEDHGPFLNVDHFMNLSFCGNLEALPVVEYYSFVGWY